MKPLQDSKMLLTFWSQLSTKDLHPMISKNICNGYAFLIFATGRSDNYKVTRPPAYSNYTKLFCTFNNNSYFSGFGDDDVNSLVKHFLPYLSAAYSTTDVIEEDFVGEAMLEWDELKTKIYGR
jgi:hypothetical protein